MMQANKTAAELRCDCCGRHGKSGEKEGDTCGAMIPRRTVNEGEYTYGFAAHPCVMGKLITLEEYNKPKMTFAGFMYKGRFYTPEELEQLEQLKNNK